MKFKKKTMKALVKEARKLVKRHGVEAALGLVTGLVGTIVAEAASKKVKGKQREQAQASAPGVEAAAPEERSEEVRPAAVSASTDGAAPGQPEVAEQEQPTRPQPARRKARSKHAEGSGAI